jgi:uncharacterized damage-inducible protein DinB
MNPLVTHVNYDRWANLALLDAASALDREAFMRPLGGSFPSVQLAFVHILWAESLWLARWQGQSFTATIDPQAYPTPQSLNHALEAVHSEQLVFLTGTPDSSLDRPITYVNFHGQSWAYPLCEMVQHLIVHSAFHRGQVASLLRQLGLVPPHTDYLVYVDTLAAKGA